MTANVDPRLRAFLALRSDLTTWRAEDDTRPVIVRHAGGLLRLRNDVPATRADCPTARPCPHVRCEWHLWYESSSDRRGRRWNGRAPGDTLRPAWLETPLPPSCGADIADALAEKGERMPIAELARVMNLKASRVHEILATCSEKLRALDLEDDDVATR